MSLSLPPSLSPSLPPSLPPSLSLSLTLRSEQSEPSPSLCLISCVPSSGMNHHYLPLEVKLGLKQSPQHWLNSDGSVSGECVRNSFDLNINNGLYSFNTRQAETQRRNTHAAPHRLKWQSFFPKGQEVREVVRIRSEVMERQILERHMQTQLFCEWNKPLSSKDSYKYDHRPLESKVI